jgi:zona occludens toxin
MITLITGKPGCGKSLYVVHEVIRTACEEGRAVYVDGIPGLKYAVLQCEDLQRWPDWVPDGSLIVIDEAQRVWRPRGSGSAVPVSVGALETHRHHGLDFVIVTQDPGLIDSNVRRLVGRHIHLRATGLGRWLYEWPEAVSVDTWKTAPVKIKWHLPKKSFSAYESASVHVKAHHAIPTAAWVVLIALGVVGSGSWYLYHRISGLLHPSVPGAISTAQAQDGARTALAGHAPPGPVPWSLDAEIPRDARFPQSAPAYDALRVVSQMPVVSGCVASASRCVCVTQQGTDAGLSVGECRFRIEHRQFDPYRDPYRESVAPGGASSSPVATPVPNPAPAAPRV